MGFNSGFKGLTTTFAAMSGLQ